MRGPFPGPDIEWTQNPHSLFVDIELMTCNHHLKQAELYNILVIVYYLKTFVLEKLNNANQKKIAAARQNCIYILNENNFERVSFLTELKI